MTVLILHRGRAGDYPYHRWLADLDEDLVLLASAEDLDGEPAAAPGDGYAHVEVIAGWDAGGEPEARVWELAGRHRFTRIVARHERDLLRAAGLRQMLGLPGHQPAEALAFRDKALMKRLAAEAGIPVADYRVIDDWADALSFAEHHGYPIVVKSRTGGGAMDNWTAHSADELVDILDGPLDAHRRLEPNLLVEAFVHGPMYHIDGVAVGGKLALAWPSQYRDPLGSFRVDPVRLDVMLDPDDEATARLLDFAERVMLALPAPDVCAFHTEVFREPSDRLVLCEVACRAGGARIPGMMAAAFGADLTAMATRGQLALPVPELVPAMPRPAMLAGQILVMKRPGTVVAVPTEIPLPGVRGYQPKVTVGQHLAGAMASGDVAASAVVTGPTSEVVEQRLRDARDFMRRELIIDA